MENMTSYAELFKILIYANEINVTSQKGNSGGKYKKMNICARDPYHGFVRFLNNYLLLT